MIEVSVENQKMGSRMSYLHNPQNFRSLSDILIWHFQVTSNFKTRHSPR